MSSYKRINSELKRIESRKICPSDSPIYKRILRLKTTNPELYENCLIRYINILTKLIKDDKIIYIDTLLDKVNEYGSESLTPSEKNIMNYSNNTI